MFVNYCGVYDSKKMFVNVDCASFAHRTLLVIISHLREFGRGESINQIYLVCLCLFLNCLCLFLNVQQQHYEHNLLYVKGKTPSPFLHMCA